jgi:hypothetical protein
MRYGLGTSRWRRLWLLAALAGAASLLAGVFPAATAASAASATFKITKLVRAHTIVLENGAHKTLKIDWTGPATFPVTARYVPAPGCTQGSITCYPGHHKFTTSANPLVWKGAAWCTGNAPTWTGKWYVFLVDANHTKTAKVTWTITCEQ